jgi:UbiD family decarboxylase
MEWAIAYHVDPKEDLVIFPGLPGSTADPSVDPLLRNPFIFGVGRYNLFVAK